PEIVENFEGDSFNYDMMEFFNRCGTHYIKAFSHKRGFILTLIKLPENIANSNKANFKLQLDWLKKLLDPRVNKSDLKSFFPSPENYKNIEVKLDFVGINNELVKNLEIKNLQQYLQQKDLIVKMLKDNSDLQFVVPLKIELASWQEYYKKNNLSADKNWLEKWSLCDKKNEDQCLQYLNK
ncbi:MAG: hypothetical protein HQK51_19260, partial [Oligoflexia bacterium]|nr:hypothetical protein [Oligoflexia bacterium]